ncbi:MAG TPA: nucleotidyltransferase family protein [Polyangiales bacterium]|nr:nucleotidyltransferase family protein [Polyangiales bacterium]
MLTGCAILAAGASRRLGQPKQLVEIAGQPLVRRVTQLARKGGCEHIGVVIGCQGAEVAAALSGASCELLENTDWAEGIAASVRVAARWAEDRGFAALMLLVCDQLNLSAAHLAQLWTMWRAAPETAVASAYAGTLGVPAIFPRVDYAALLQLRGDQGAARLLRARPAKQIAWPEGEAELDTPEDLAKLTP